jgi:excisionase family DNA binding protein
MQSLPLPAESRSIRPTGDPDYLDVSRETVLQRINNRGTPAHKVGRQWKFKISEIDEWICSGKEADKE